MKKIKRFKQILLSVCTVAVLSFTFNQPVFAMTESEIQAQVNAVGKETASGSVLIWFLCAIAFLKVSQKIDSFMSSLGINVGHTGGSMLAEAMVAARGIGGLKNFSSQHFGGGRGRVSSHTDAGSKGFMSGGLAGIVSSRITNSAVKSATASSKTNVSRSSGKTGGGIGSHIYASSVSKGGSFANNVIGTVAMAEWSYRNGYWCRDSGSYHALIPAAARNWGLNVSGCTASEPQRILDALADGKLVVAIMSQGHFTKSGHFIVLRGVQNGKILVADPASYHRSGQLWDLSIILKEASRGAAAGGPFWIIG